MVSDLKSDIRAAVFRLSAAYLLVLVIATSSAVYLKIVHQKKLADAFAEAARNSLAIRDLRQAIAILTPSLRDNFDGVTFVTANGELVFALPSDSSFKEKVDSYSAKLEMVPITLSTWPTEQTLGRLTFTYRWTGPVYFSLAIWTALLLFAAPIFRVMRLSIERRHQEILKARESELLIEVAKQVSHDIRSPLSAINLVIKSLSDIPDDKRALIQGAAQRINGIANDLLNRQKTWHNQSLSPAHAHTIDSKPTRLAALLESIGSEKTVLLAGRQGIRFVLDITRPLEAECLVDEKELGRAISNIVNNAAEAIDPSVDGLVTLSLRPSGPKEAAIIISDNGKGIPEELLSNLGKERISAGKEGTESGSGIGVLHAAKAIEAMGGKFHIQSKVGVGTIITMRFPRIDSQDTVA